MKSLKESLFDKDLVSKTLTVGDMYSKIEFQSYVQVMFELFFIDSISKKSNYVDKVTDIIKNMPLMYLDDEKLVKKYLNR